MAERFHCQKRWLNRYWHIDSGWKTNKNTVSPDFSKNHCITAREIWNLVINEKSSCMQKNNVLILEYCRWLCSFKCSLSKYLLEISVLSRQKIYVKFTNVKQLLKLTKVQYLNNVTQIHSMRVELHRCAADGDIYQFCWRDLRLFNHYRRTLHLTTASAVVNNCDWIMVSGLKYLVIKWQCHIMPET